MSDTKEKKNACMFFKSNNGIFKGFKGSRSVKLEQNSRPDCRLKYANDRILLLCALQRE